MQTKQANSVFCNCEENCLTQRPDVRGRTACCPIKQELRGDVSGSACKASTLGGLADALSKAKICQYSIAASQQDIVCLDIPMHNLQRRGRIVKIATPA